MKKNQMVKMLVQNGSYVPGSLTNGNFPEHILGVRGALQSPQKHLFVSSHYCSISDQIW